MPIDPERAKLDTTHPHRGFDNLWYILSGDASTGHSTGPGGTFERAQLGTGGLLKIRTGRGVYHAESIGADQLAEGKTGEFRSVLFWVNLARKDKQAQPTAQVVAPDELPSRTEDGAIVRTLVGPGSPVELGHAGADPRRRAARRRRVRRADPRRISTPSCGCSRARRASAPTGASARRSQIAVLGPGGGLAVSERSARDEVHAHGRQAVRRGADLQRPVRRLRADFGRPPGQPRGDRDLGSAARSARQQPDLQEIDHVREPQAATHDVVGTRVLDAPVDEVWRAWVEPELIKQWWGPTGFTVPVAEMDVREGGESLVSMAVTGLTVYNTWTYSRVVPLERLEFVNRFVDADRQVRYPKLFDVPAGVPREVPHVVTFRALPDGRTEMTSPSPAMRPPRPRPARAPASNRPSTSSSRSSPADRTARSTGPLAIYDRGGLPAVMCCLSSDDSIRVWSPLPLPGHVFKLDDLPFWHGISGQGLGDYPRPAGGHVGAHRIDGRPIRRATPAGSPTRAAP